MPNYCSWIWLSKQSYARAEMKLDIVCGKTQVWEDVKIKDFEKSKNSYRSAREGQAAVWATFSNFTHTKATSSNRSKSHFTPSSLDHHLPAGWERSSRRACPSGRRSDGASASHFRWTWSPGSHRGGAGFVAAPCPRSEMGWTSSPLQGEWRRSKDRFVIRILIWPWHISGHLCCSRSVHVRL